MTNLIGNAIKFTDHGSVKVQLSTKPGYPSQAADSTKLIQIQVQDTGPGIPPDEQAGLFEGFVTGKHTRSGSGLGLHLSRRIMEVHDGTITVESEVGRGSIFTARMPARQMAYATVAARERVE